MSLRWFAALAAFGLVIAASAGEKKKLDFAPETGPQPRQVPECGGMTLPSPHCLEVHPPQYFPEETPLPGVCCSRPAERQIVRTYAVADLVIPMPPVGISRTEKPATLEAELIKKICAAVEPKSWSGHGGQNSIEYFPLGLALVVNADPTVQTAIEKYLDGLRQIQDTQFQVKVVVMTVTDAALEKMGLARDFGPTGAKAGEVRTRVKFLSADEVRGLAVEKAQCVELTAPTLTVLNGQKGCVKCSEVEHFLTGVTVQVIDGKIIYTPKNEPHDLGVVVDVLPTVSADQKFVKLAVSAQSRDLTVRPVATIPLIVPGRIAELTGRQADPAGITQFLQDPRIVTRSVDETVTLPDGGTVVFYGGPATSEETVREQAPMLADVPFLQEFMVREKKVSSTNHLLVFATPRTIKASECDECVQCAGGNSKLGKMMAEYTRACRDGHTDEARRLAMECLVIDPTCFSKK